MREARRLNIPVFAMVDTCCDPTDIDYVIPANDDRAQSIAVILDAMCGAINEGLEERRIEKEKEAEENAAKEVAPEKKTRARKSVKVEVEATEEAVEAPAAEEAAAE